MSRRVRSFGWVAGFAIVLFGLEYGAFPVLGVERVAPCLIVALTVTVSLSLGPMAGAVFALILGFMADTLTGWGLGLNMLSLSLTAALCSGTPMRDKADRLLTPLGLGARCYLVKRTAELIVLYVSRLPLVPEGPALMRLVASALFTGLAAMALHGVLYRRLSPAPDDMLRRHSDYLR